MSFKEAMQSDINNVFLNTKEFAETYIIDDVPIIGVLSYDQFEKRLERTAVDYSEEISLQGAIFTAEMSQFYRTPIRGEAWVLNGVSFTVNQVSPKPTGVIQDNGRMGGIYTITLIRNVGR